MGNRSKATSRRLRHGIPYCFLKNCVVTLDKPSGGDDTAMIQAAIDKVAAIKEGDERHCRCGRTWRVAGGDWKLVLHRA